MRNDIERHRDQTRSAARARNKALRDLAREFPDAYRTLYEKYALEEGILPNSYRARMVVEAQRDSA